MSLRSTSISFCPSGRPSRGGMRPAPAPRLSGGFPQQNLFPDGPDAIRSQLNAPSRRIPAARPGKRFCLGVCDASSKSKPRSKPKKQRIKTRQKYFKNTSRTLQRHFKGTSKALQRHFKGTSELKVRLHFADALFRCHFIQHSTQSSDLSYQLLRLKIKLRIKE